jgi:hypothetical protein
MTPATGDAVTAPQLVGREDELAAIGTFLDAVARGPASLVLSGPAGIGTTTLWRALLADARHRGYRTLETRAVEAEAQLAFGGLTDLLGGSVDEVLGRLAPAAPTGSTLADRLDSEYLRAISRSW